MEQLWGRRTEQGDRTFGGGAGTPAITLPHFHYPHRTQAAKTKFKTTTVETAELAARKKGRAKSKPRTNQDETIPQEGAKVRREMCLLHNEMKALKKG